MLRTMQPKDTAPIRTATARRSLPFERYSAEQGLSQTIVECILLDRRGFLWLGTEDGLNRFDGYEFRVFRHTTDDPASLSYSEITCFLEDSSGALWVGTFAGLNRFDPGSETCRRFVHAPDDRRSLAGDIVRALCQDRSGNLWVGIQGGGLDRLDPVTGRIVHHRNNLRSPGRDDVRAILEDGAGRLWIGTTGGLDRLDPTTGRCRHFRHDPGDPDSLCHDWVTALHQDCEGRLWIGTTGGLDRLENSCFLHHGHGLAHAKITAICDQEDGRLWIGLDGGGLDLLDPESGMVVHHRHDPRDKTSLGTDRVLSLCRDGAGGLWVGTYGGGGLAKAEPRKARFQHYRRHPDDPQSLCHAIVWSIWEDAQRILWVGTDGGLDRIDRGSGEITHFLPNPENPRGLVDHGVRAVYEGPSGSLWIGTNGGLQRLDRDSGHFERFVHDPEDPTSLSHDEIRTLHEDGAGYVAPQARKRYLWIATLGGGLNLFDPETAAFTAFRHDPGDPSSLGSDFLRALHQDRHGDLWLGVQGAGLDRFDPKTGRSIHFRHDPRDPGTLSSDFVFSIWEDPEGMLWLGTYAGGLDRFDPRTGRVRRYSEADGLPCNLIYSLVGDDDGNLWMSSNKGLTRFDPLTERFRTYDWRDGLQADEFNGGSYHKNARGELFFGGINGFNAFFPAAIEDSRFEPPVALTHFQLAGRSLVPGEAIDGRVPLAAGLACAQAIRLTHRDRVFSFQFAALDFSNPRKNRYAFRMVGFDKRWQQADASHRFATYTNLPPGKYRFEVRGTNSDGVWSGHRASIRVAIASPVWGTWWFRALAAAAAAGVAARSYRDRVGTIRLQTELAAAREAQRSIWPRGDPSLPGFEIAAASLPASEVGGDFFDFIWLDPVHEKLCIAIGDVAGKAMSAAMTAVMASGMVAAKLEDGGSLEAALRSINRLVFRKAAMSSRPARKLTALCLAGLESSTRELRWVNAGLAEPLLLSSQEARFLATPNPRFPLGVREEEAYREQRTRLAAGDVLVLYTDGVPEAQSPAGEVYGYEALKARLEALPTAGMSSRQILRVLLDDAGSFAAGLPQQDDMTMVVVKVAGDGEP
ncbi:MAG: SpoIIE family protein phosphatase [bacterium]|nr:SpoIIE family protein phosphatase [bacterium]